MVSRLAFFDSTCISAFTGASLLALNPPRANSAFGAIIRGAHIPDDADVSAVDMARKKFERN